MASTQNTYTTSQLAEAANVGSQTLRYYERRGLLPEPPRTEGGHRIYGPQHLARLHFIQGVQQLGFQLDEIHALLRVGEPADHASVNPELLDDFIERIDEKAETLSEMRARIAAMRARATLELRETG